MNRDDMQRKFRYRCLHIPSGQIVEAHASFWTRFDFLEALNKWNAQGPNLGLWKYWTEE